MKVRRMRGARTPYAVVAVLAVLVALVATGTASAATHTQITTPGDPTFASFNGDLSSLDPTNQVAISGNSDDTNGEQLNIRCFYSDSGGGGRDWQNIGTAIPDASGNFSGFYPMNNWWFDQACALRAVPNSVDSSTANLMPFSGPVTGIGQNRNSSYRGGSDNSCSHSNASTGTPCNFFVQFPQTLGHFEYDSFGRCGPFGAANTDGQTFQQFNNYSWDCAASVYAQDYTNTRSEIVVDGADAFAADSAPGNVPDTNNSNTPTNIAGQPGVTYSASVDRATGNATIHETETLVKCDTPQGTAPTQGNYTLQNCPSLSSTGVRLDRTMTQDHAGRLSTVEDHYVDVSGAQHKVDVEYDNYLSYSEPPAWNLPGSTGFYEYGNGDTLTLPPASTGTIYARDSSAPDGSNGETGAPASLSYSTRPDSVTFNSQCCTNSDDMLTNYVRTVPAGGMVSITQAYGQANTMAALQEVAQAAQGSFSSPTVSFVAPGNGATVGSATQLVRLAASDATGLSTVTLNGAPVNFNPATGTWDMQVALNPGNNVLTAVATNKGGRAAQASEAVIYAPPAAPLPNCLVPTVVYLPLAQAKLALVNAHCAVGRVTITHTKTFPAGRVISQGQAPATALPFNSKVNVSVAQPKKKKHKAKKHKKAKKKAKKKK